MFFYLGVNGDANGLGTGIVLTCFTVAFNCFVILNAFYLGVNGDANGLGTGIV